MIGVISRAVITAITRRFFLGKIHGIEHLPDKGPYIIVANHASFMDHFIIATVLRYYRKERVYYLTKKESFETFLSRIWHLSVGCIPLNRNAADTTAFRTVLRYLADGKIICIYPEGTRSFTGRMLPGKPGAVKLAMLAKVPIVPIGMERTFDILPKNRMIPRRIRAIVRIGEPIYPGKGRGKKEIEVATLHVMREIAKLSNETGTDYEKLSNENGIKPPNALEMLDVATEWNEIGIRQGLTYPIPPKLLFYRAKYIAEEVLKTNPELPRAHFELGRALGRLALLSNPVKKIFLAFKSKRRFEMAIRLDPKFAHAHYALGMWYLSIPKMFGGDPKKALAQYQLAVQLNPEEIFLYMGLGQCQLKLNLIEDARKTFLRVLELPSIRPEDDRRKLEAMVQLLRIEPYTKFERGLIYSCFTGLQNG
ncbi:MULTISPECIES: 1-acyl-sn-glycerol-3-phosphate acyltransferase [Anoxybacillaceae]|uniref:1-acyl-sn-glycerol-3-phosphate acyltransferase n=1 Tax=Anoxybacillaceae TaxID=3120669 RepID=UPI002285A245|nr:1-acyl-sn-glycerol-3-phosphate acyltransferase [Anoxybacillus sp. J5B_2022]MCZ0754127.1 1-acyl-sn-glycerol-3-phosphate acyltransferase [Anoxybacillus sp. J5B_2022]